MAAIETLQYITKDPDRDGIYYVNGRAFVGAGIDDVTDATFYIDSGMLRWAAGCTTTFTNCTFVEGKACDNLGDNNTYAGMPRWASDTTCAPVFKGCTWLIEHTVGDNPTNPTEDINPDNGVPATATKYHEWEISVKCSAKFIKDDQGQYCRIVYNNYDTTTGSYGGGNSWYTGVGVTDSGTKGSLQIDGLVVDTHGTPFYGEADFGTANIKNIILVNNDPGYNEIHFMLNGDKIVYSYDVNVGSLVVPVYNLEARNVGCYYGGAANAAGVNDNVFVKLVNPKGHIAKPAALLGRSDVNGRVSTYRSLEMDFLDPFTGSAVQDVKLVISKISDNSVALNETSSSFYTELHQFTQDWFSVTEVVDNEYGLAFGKYGYQLSKQNLVIEDLDQATGYNKRGTLLLPDLKITSNESTISSLTELSSPEDIYDYLMYYQYQTEDYFTNTPAQPIVDIVGSSLYIKNHNIVFNPSLEQVVYKTTTSVDEPLVWTPGSFTEDPASMPTIASGLLGTFDLTSLVPGITGVYDIKFSDDGLNAIVSGKDTANKLYSFSLTTEYDLSTATLTGNFNHWAMGGTGNSNAFDIVRGGPYAGTRILLMRDSSDNALIYDLATPWNVSSATFVTNYAGIHNNGGWERTIAFSGDGTAINITVANQYQISTYDLTTPWDIATRANRVDSEEGGAGSWNQLSTYVPNKGLLVVRKTRGTTLLDAIIQTNRNRINSPTTELVNFNTASAQNAAYYTNLDYVLGATTNSAGSIDTTNFMQVTSGVKADNSTLLFFTDASGIMYTYSYPGVTVEAAYSGGKVNTIYLKATNIATSLNINSLESSEFVYFENGAGTGLTVRDAAGSLTSLTIDGINPNTEIRIFRASDDSEVLGLENSSGNSASFNYTYVTPENWYIVLHNTEYTTSPPRVAFTTQAAPATITVFQQRDRAFRNP